MVPEYKVAVADVIEGLANWPMWGRLGWQEVKRRYRRTTIGPFWSTLSLGVFIFALGFVWANLWHQDVHIFLPFLSAGLLAWTLITTIINESCSVFISAEAMIKQLQFSYAMLALSVVWRNLIVFGHNMVIIGLVFLIFPPATSWAIVLVFPGLLLLIVNGAWIGLLLGLACSRFRDIQQLVVTLLQIALFVTPIFWVPEQIGPELRPILRLNLLYDLVDVVRAPLLGQVPTGWSYMYVSLWAVLGWAATLYIFAWFRQRLPYWL